MDEKEYIAFLLNLPPEEIIKWYESKGYTFSWKWQDVWQAAHTRTFTVAKVMKLDILQAIKKEVDNIFKSGITFEQFQRELEPTLKRLGWWGKVKAKDVPGYKPGPGIDPEKIVELGSPRRLKTIYQVNTIIGYNSGQYNSDIQNAKSRPYWMYVQIDRETKRKSHEPFAGKVFMWNDPIWKFIYPPNGWLCGCYIRPLTELEFKTLKLNLSNGKDFMSKIEKYIPEEWQYNPAEEYSTWQPDVFKFDEDIRKLF